MLPLVNLTVGELLNKTADSFPARPAVIYRDRTYTYSELRSAVELRAQWLLDTGIRRGSHVAIFSDTELDTLLFFYAIQYIGAKVLMINPLLERLDLESAVNNSDVELLLVGCTYKPGKSLPELCCESDLRCGAMMTFPGTHADCFPEVKLPERLEDRSALDAAMAAVKPEDTAVMFSTSGSTGMPKLVMTSHYSRVNSGIQQGYDLRATENDVFCMAVPMFHCFCISANVLAALSWGACLCIPDDRHTESILYAIEKHHCTVLNSVPTLFKAILAREDFAQRDLSSLRIGIIGGSYCPPEDFVRIEKSFGLKLMSSLGQTECTAGLTVCNVDDSIEVRSTTVGHFMSHVEGKIADINTGKTLPTGERGEICVRGYLVMQGYYKQPGLTKKTLDKNGWLHTGDLGFLDADGNIHMAGRIKELIIRGGENISPSEIEAQLISARGVEACKVVGVPDKHYGEEICACVQLENGKTVTEEQLREFLSERLAQYKVPKYFLFWTAFPTTATGKINPVKTAKQAANELGLN